MAPLKDVDADLLVLLHGQEGNLTGRAAEVDKATKGAFKALIDQRVVHGPRFFDRVDLSCATQDQRVLLLGSGKAEDIDVRSLRRLAAAAVRHGRAKKARRVCLAFDWPKSIDAARQSSLWLMAL